MSEKKTGLTLDAVKKGFPDVLITDPENICRFWQTLPPNSEELFVSQSGEALEFAAKENRDKRGDEWILSLEPGSSLFSKIGVAGTDRNHQPCFWKNSEQTLRGDSENEWAKLVRPPRFYLINLKPHFGGINWHGQECEIAQLFAKHGLRFGRANTNAFAGTVIYLFSENGRQITFDGGTWAHWGKEEAAGGRRVLSGIFGEDGFGLCAAHPECSYGILRVALALESDFN